MRFSLSKYFKKKGAEVPVPEPESFLKACRSIVHLGANTGQERDLYQRLGLDVLWIEALPDVFAQLKINIAPLHRQRAVHALVAEIAGQKRTLHISNNEGLSSSLFDLADHKKLWPDVAYSGQIELTTSTLDQLLTANGDSRTRVDALIMDIQGAELLALQGAPNLLREVYYIKAEASDFESYAGACTLQSLDGFLAPLGFEIKEQQCFAGKEEVGSYFDVLWVKKAKSERPPDVADNLQKSPHPDRPANHSQFGFVRRTHQSATRS